MFKSLKILGDVVKEFDNLTKKNKFMTNPFKKVINETYVWTEKEMEYKSIFKK